MASWGRSTLVHAGPAGRTAVLILLLAAAAPSVAAVGEPTADFHWEPEPACAGETTTFVSDSSSAPGTTLDWAGIDFGDGGSASGPYQPAIDHVYAVAATYTVHLQVRASNGLTDTMSKEVVVRDCRVPLVDFDWTPAGPCVADAVAFRDRTPQPSQGVLLTARWDFGDGTPPATGPWSPERQHAFAEPGTYSVTLEVGTSRGFTGQATRDVTVTDCVAPAVAFDWTPLRPCAGQLVTFHDRTVVRPPASKQNMTWEFGDGAVLGPAPWNPLTEHAYAAPGFYDVTLTVTTDQGSSGSGTQALQVRDCRQPTAAFDWQPSAPCVGEAVTFHDRSQPPPGSVLVASQWDFGDGTPATTQPWAEARTHAFARPGTFGVVLEVTAANGFTDTAVHAVAVADCTDPVVDFAWDPAEPCAGESVAFEDRTLVSPGAAKQSMAWDFGDGSTLGPAPWAATVTHTYAAPGTVDVTLAITTDGGGSGSATKSIPLRDCSPPVVGFDWSPAEPCAGQPVTFRDLSEAPPGETLLTSRWDFGDGTPSATAPWAPSHGHTYRDAGTYRVTLEVATAGGAASEASRWVDVAPCSPMAVEFDWTPLAPCPGEAVTFHDRSVVAPSNPKRFMSWDFGDGTGTGAVVWRADTSHTYGAPGAHLVTLTLETADGSVGSATKTVDVPDCTPATVIFDWEPASPCTGEAVTFHDRTLSPPGQSLVANAWDFGDGTVLAAPPQTDVAHAYAEPGTHTVTLNVTSSSGAVGTASQALGVRDCAPVAAAFDGSPALPCAGDAVTFTDRSATSPLSTKSAMAWDFGDGSTLGPTAYADTVGHAFPEPGTYTVAYTLWTGDGANGTASRDVLVRGCGEPTADFTWSPPSPCAGRAVTFQDLSAAPPGESLVAMRWDFGDGSTAALPWQESTDHAYAVAGTYNVTLNVTASNGFTGEATRTVEALDCTSPVAAFDWDPPAPCEGKRVTFSDRSVASDGNPLVSMRWQFGDGASLGPAAWQPTVEHAFAAAGAYAVNLTVTGQNGQEGNVSRTLAVRHCAAPAAAFTWEPAAPCSASTATFHDLSSAPAGESLVAMRWDFGDGTVAALPWQESTDHAYAVAGTYNVTLNVTASNGFTGEARRMVTVRDCTPPVVAFDWDPPAPCAGQTVTFSDRTAVSDGTSKQTMTWDFGDGNATGPAAWQPVIQHAFGADGPYPVTLTIVTADGASGFATEVVGVLPCPAPTADFSWNPIVPCADVDNVLFIDRSSTPGGTVLVASTWDLGDGGGPQTGPWRPSVNHTYATASTFLVRLEVTNDRGYSSSVEKSVTVSACDPPLAFFDWTPTVPCAGTETVVFRDLSTADLGDPLQEVQWDIAGTLFEGQPPGGTVSWTFSAAGVYPVTLTVFTERGQTDSASAVVQPQECLEPPVPPLADFDCAATSDTSYDIAFTDASTDDGFVVAWSWVFGDGDGSVDQDPLHTYAVRGTYNVELTVWDEEGQSDTTTRPCSTMDNLPPVLHPIGNQAVLENGTLEFLVHASDPDGDPLSFSLSSFLPGATVDALSITSARFTWEPGNGSAGAYPGIRFLVDDGQALDEEAITIWVLDGDGGPPPDDDDPLPPDPGGGSSSSSSSGGGTPVPDLDGDGVSDAADNCPSIRNLDQLDTDGDGRGDACERPDPPAVPADTDRDGTPDASDNCPYFANADQADLDLDRIGDVCDGDADGDGEPQAGASGQRLDNCPYLANPDQLDADRDGVGDRCRGDRDSDGVPDLDADGSPLDNCVWIPNRRQEDADGDGTGDACQGMASLVATPPAAQPQAVAPPDAPQGRPAWPWWTLLAAAGILLVACLALWLGRRRSAAQPQSRAWRA